MTPSMISRHGHVERAAAQVDDDGPKLALPCLEPIGEGRGRRFVDDSLDVKSGDGGCVARRLPLRVAEVCGNGDDRLVDGASERRLRVGLDGREHQRRQLLRRHATTGEFVHALRPHVALERGGGGLGRGGQASTRRCSDEDGTVGHDADHARGQQLSDRVRKDDRPIALKDGGERIRRAEIDPDDRLAARRSIRSQLPALQARWTSRITRAIDSASAEEASPDASASTCRRAVQQYPSPSERSSSLPAAASDGSPSAVAPSSRDSADRRAVARIAVVVRFGGAGGRVRVRRRRRVASPRRRQEPAQRRCGQANNPDVAPPASLHRLRVGLPVEERTQSGSEHSAGLAHALRVVGRPRVEHAKRGELRVGARPVAGADGRRKAGPHFGRKAVVERTELSNERPSGRRAPEDARLGFGAAEPAGSSLPSP